MCWGGMEHDVYASRILSVAGIGFEGPYCFPLQCLLAVCYLQEKRKSPIDCIWLLGYIFPTVYSFFPFSPFSSRVFEMYVAIPALSGFPALFS